MGGPSTMQLLWSWQRWIISESNTSFTAAA